MTRSRKLRRGVLYDKYGEIIEAMYAGQESVQVTATIVYQDGREGSLDARLRIASLEQGG
jgi:long-chain acyl-CoA synthetase